MIEIRQILCPVDRSDSSARAFDSGLMLAGWYRASLTALEVTWVNLTPVSSSAQPVLSPAELQAAAADLQQFVADGAPAGTAVHAKIGQGPVVAAIQHEARAPPPTSSSRVPC